MGGPRISAANTSDSAGFTGKPLERAQRDIVALGIAVSALILFVGIGGRVMPQILRSWLGLDAPPDMLLTNALLLNVALLLFGWRRYEELRREVIVRREAEVTSRLIVNRTSLKTQPEAIGAWIARFRAALDPA